MNEPATNPPPTTVFERVETTIEQGIFHARWLLAPIYIGLTLSLAAIAIVFLREFIHLVEVLFAREVRSESVILLILSLVDLSLVANLVLIVVFSGFESFVSKIDIRHHPDRPEWLGKIDFGGLKLKLVASIAAISAIQLLKVFMQETPPSPERVFWLVVIHLTFVTSGTLLAVMDYITAKSKTLGYQGD